MTDSLEKRPLTEAERLLGVDTTHLLTLPTEDFDALLAMLDDPPEPNENLRKLMK